MSKADDLMPSVIITMERLEKVFQELMMKEEEGFYTVHQFSGLTGMTPDTITKHCREGVLAAARVRGEKGQWLVLRSEFRRLYQEAIANYNGRVRRSLKRDSRLLKHIGLIN